MPSIKFWFGASPGYGLHFLSLIHKGDKSFRRLTIQEYWACPLAYLAMRLLDCGYTIVPSFSGEASDILWLLDLPDSRIEFLGELSRYSKSVLQIAESPIKKPFQWSSAISSVFDRVLNYSVINVTDSEQKYVLPFSSFIGKSFNSRLPDFEERSDCCAINTKRAKTVKTRVASAYERFMSVVSRDPWTKAVYPKALLAKMADPPFTIEQLVSFFCDDSTVDFILYGSGWDLRSSTLGFLPSRQPPRCLADSSLQSHILGDKLDLLSNFRFSVVIENACGDIGYVSEKVFDSMITGCVPIYAGDGAFTARYDGDVLFALSRFSSIHDLACFIHSFDASSWLAMSRRCIEFVNSSNWSQPKRYDSFASCGAALLDAL